MKITVNLTVKDLFTFSMYNSSSGFSGLFNLFFTAGAIFVLAAYSLCPAFFCYTAVNPLQKVTETGKKTGL